MEESCERGRLKEMRAPFLFLADGTLRKALNTYDLAEMRCSAMLSPYEGCTA